MKKLMIVAVAAIVAASAFAQNPDALKQVKKAKTFNDAQTLISANESSMSAAENAQAYNKCVDLLMPSIPADKVGTPDFSDDALCEALSAAMKCDKYDAQPNDKGKVSPKFHKTNGDRLYNLTFSLINAGNNGWTSQNYAQAEKYFGAYCDAIASGLFDGQMEAQEKTVKDQAKLMAKAENKTEEEYCDEHSVVAQYYEICKFAASAAFYAKDKDGAMKYANYMLKDTKNANTAVDLMSSFASQDLTTREDSIACEKQLESLSEKYPNNENVFIVLSSMYNGLGQKDKLNQLVNNKVTSDPNNYIGWAWKGQNALYDKNYDSAIEALTKATSCQIDDKSTKANVYGILARAYYEKATTLDKYEDQIEVLKQAIPVLEKARELDPNNEGRSWGYLLYNCYYNVYGADDSRTNEVKALIGM